MVKYEDAGDTDLDEEVVYRKDGTRLDEAAAEKLGEEIAARGRSGRPSLSGRAKHSPQVGVRLSDDVHAALTERASTEGKRVSDIVREAIESYL